MFCTIFKNFVNLVKTGHMKHVYSLFILMLAFGVSAIAQSTTYSNNTPIVIVDNATASIYSSNITVSGYTGTLSSVAVVVRNFSHSAPTDVAICLEAPSGQKMLIQDQCWGAPATDITYMLSDLGSSQIGIWDLPSNGTFKPTANSGLVNFNSPGPGLGYNNPGPGGAGSSTFASTFSNATPNGTWKLWIVDVSGGDAGVINGGWQLLFNPNSVLPVELANFKATCETNNVLAVNWTTYNEANSRDFTLQVSADGTYFEDAKTINASGNSQIEMTYKASIVMPYAKTFVRLRLADLNDQYTYSDVLEIKCGAELPIKISPNPVIDHVVIDNPNAEFMQYELTDINGKVLKKGTSKSVHHRVDIESNLGKGIYFLHVKSPTTEHNFKLNKQ